MSSEGIPGRQTQEVELTPEQIDAAIEQESAKLEGNVDTLSANEERVSMLSDEQGKKLVEFLQKNFWTEVGGIMATVGIVSNTFNGNELSWAAIAGGIGLSVGAGKMLDLALSALANEWKKLTPNEERRLIDKRREAMQTEESQPE